jgi:hypothetical protein
MGRNGSPTTTRPAAPPMPPASQRVWNREQRRGFDRFLQSAEGKAAAAKAKAAHTERAQEAEIARAILEEANK